MNTTASIELVVVVGNKDNQNTLAENLNNEPQFDIQEIATRTAHNTRSRPNNNQSSNKTSTKPTKPTKKHKAS